MAIKYFEHFLYIAHAMTNMDGEGIDLWDDEDQFFYDVVHLTSGENIPLKIHSMVGLVPLFAVLASSTAQTAGLAEFQARADWFIQHRPDLLKNVAPWSVPGPTRPRCSRSCTASGCRAVLQRMLDPEEFLSDYGVRALSRYHREHPYVLEVPGRTLRVKYLPGRIGQPPLRRQLELAGPGLVSGELPDRPVATGVSQALWGQPQGRMSYRLGADGDAGRGGQGIDERLTNLFLPDPAAGGRRAAWGDNDYFQTDPHWRDCIPFFEYFHGDTGAGLGASHQTGWTALVAALMME